MHSHFTFCLFLWFITISNHHFLKTFLRQRSAKGKATTIREIRFTYKDSLACRWIICCCTASKLLPLLQPPFAGGTEGSSRRLSFTNTVESRTKEFGGWIFSHHQLINWKKAGIINETKSPKLSYCIVTF